MQIGLLHINIDVRAKMSAHIHFINCAGKPHRCKYKRLSTYKFCKKWLKVVQEQFQKGQPHINVGVSAKIKVARCSGEPSSMYKCK